MARERVQIQLLHILRRRLQDHLILIIVLQPVGVLAIAAVGGPARGLDKGGVPGPRPQRAQGGGGMEGARPHLIVIGLQDQAALGRPEILQGQDQVLKGAGFPATDSRLSGDGPEPIGGPQPGQAPRRAATRRRLRGPSPVLVGAEPAPAAGAKGARGTLAGLQDHPLGRLARPGQSGKMLTPATRQRRQRLVQPVGAQDGGEIAARNRALQAKLQPVAQAGRRPSGRAARAASGEAWPSP